MPDFDGPGEGWREVGVESAHPGVERVIYLTADDVRGGVWVREEPVPPLPTAEDTLIRVTWKSSGTQYRFALDKHSVWQPVGLTMPYQPEQLRERITGFEVLAVPETAGVIARTVAAENKRVRRETAKAVLDRVWPYVDTTEGEQVLDALRDEFGVSS